MRSLRDRSLRRALQVNAGVERQSMEHRSMSGPDSSMESYRSGQTAFEEGNFEEAARLFGESVRAFPHFKSLELLYASRYGPQHEVHRQSGFGSLATEARHEPRAFPTPAEWAAWFQRGGVFGPEAGWVLQSSDSAP